MQRLLHGERVVDVPAATTTQKQTAEALGALLGRPVRSAGPDGETELAYGLEFLVEARGPRGERGDLEHFSSGYDPSGRFITAVTRGWILADGTYDPF